MPVDVLIVDDSAAIRKILQRVLRQADVRIGQVWEAGTRHRSTGSDEKRDQ